MVRTPGTVGDTRLARLLFPELATELDNALETHAKGVAASNGLRHDSESGASRIDRLLDRAADEVREGIFGKAAFAGVTEPEALRIEEAFAAARTVASWVGLEVPEPEEFWAAGVDPKTLAGALGSHAELVPVLAPHGIGSEQWIELFRAAARQAGSPLSLGVPLVIAQEVVAAFHELEVPEVGVPVVGQTRRASGARTEPIQWTLRLIPATQVPPRVNANHALGPHPTLSEMLMLQLTLTATGREPVDQHSFTWLSGTFAGGRFAARHFFDTAAGSVGVNAREVGNQGPHLGVRHPVSNELPGTGGVSSGRR